MGYTTVGYYQNIDSATLAALDAIPDSHVRVQGKDIIVPRGYNRLLGVYAVGPSLSGLRLQSPSLRRMFLPDVNNVIRGTVPATPLNVFNRFDNPFELDEDEALNVLASEDGAGATNIWAFVFLGDAPRSPETGPIFTIRATATDAATANKWTPVSLTFSQSLPAGRYAVVGSVHRSATAIAHRYVFVGGVWRPGGPSTTGEFDYGNPLFRHGNLGTWGEFNHNTPPSIEVLCSAADASHVFYIDLIKIG
jgi:hypothetical protein